MCPCDAEGIRQRGIQQEADQQTAVVPHQKIHARNHLDQIQEAHQMSVLRCNQWTGEKGSGFVEDLARTVSGQKSYRPNNVTSTWFVFIIIITFIFYI